MFPSDFLLSVLGFSVKLSIPYMYNLCTPTPMHTYTPIALDLPDNYFRALQDSLMSESNLGGGKELKSTELLILLNLNSILLNLHSFT